MGLARVLTRPGRLRSWRVTSDELCLRMSDLRARVRWVAKQLVYNNQQSGSLPELGILGVGEDFHLYLVGKACVATEGASFASVNLPPGCPLDHGWRRREQRQGDLAPLTMLNQPMCQPGDSKGGVAPLVDDCEDRLFEYDETPLVFEAVLETLLEEGGGLFRRRRWR